MKITVSYPEKKLDNLQISSLFPEWSAEKIYSKLGISSRHVADDGETALDLAERACAELLKEEKKEEIDFILVCTQSPDYVLPPDACLLQDRLGLRKDVGAYDFSLGCSGYIYGLAQAKGLISAGIAQKILLVTAETYTKYIHPLDRGNRSVFGDAATATLLSEGGCEIGNFVLGTDGSGAQNLIVKNGGARSKYTRDALLKEYSNGKSTDNELFMNGPEIFNFTIEVVPPMLNDVLQKNFMTLNDVDFVILHQANKYMLNFLRKIAEIPEEKFVMHFENEGNTVSSTIPIALEHLMRDGRIVKGTKILLAGFGVGYSYGATVLTF